MTDNNSMKLRIVAIFITVIFQLNLAAQSNYRPVDNNAQQPKKELGVEYTLETKNTSVEQKLLKIPGMDTHYQDCLIKQKNSEKFEGMSSCLWNKVKDTKLESEVVKVLEQGDNKNRYDSLSLGSVRTEKSEGMKVLQDYLFKRLSEVLFVDNSTGKKREKVVDQKVFFELYKSQLGKNIILAMSDYCIEADDDNESILYSDQSKRDDIKQKHLGNLDQVTANNKKVQSAADWEKCIIQIQHHCHRVKYDYDTSTPDEEEYERHFSKKICASSNTPASSINGFNDCTSEQRNDFEYTQKRACEVTNYLTAARQNLIAVDKIQGHYDQNFKGRGVHSLNGFEAYDGQTQGETVDDLVSVTSNEYVNKSGLLKSSQDEAKKIADCRENVKNGKLTQDCKKYLDADTDELSESVAETSLRLNALEGKIKKISNKQEVETYLKDQGYTKNQIDEELKLTVDELKKRINDRYAAKKAAILANLEEKLDEKTVLKPGQKVDDLDLSDAATQQEVAKALERLERKIQKEAQGHAQLIHFNNIVSGYLEVKTSPTQSGKNTASISRELGDSFFSDKNYKDAKKNRAPSATNGNANAQNGRVLDNKYDDFSDKIANDFKKSEKGIEKTGVKKGQGSTPGQDTTHLDVDTINDQLLNVKKRPGSKDDENNNN